MAAQTSEPAVASGQDNGDGQQLSYQINRKIYFAKPDSNGNILVRNSETNEFYISVNILIPETEESLLFTGFIRPGEARDKARLSKEMEEGVYECIAEITAYNPDTLEAIGTLEEPVALYIGEKP